MKFIESLVFRFQMPSSVWLINLTFLYRNQRKKSENTGNNIIYLSFEQWTKNRCSQLAAVYKKRNSAAWSFTPLIKKKFIYYRYDSELILEKPENSRNLVLSPYLYLYQTDTLYINVIDVEKSKVYRKEFILDGHME